MSSHAQGNRIAARAHGEGREVPKTVLGGRGVWDALRKRAYCHRKVEGYLCILVVYPK